jgi:hypothetical protein
MQAGKTTKQSRKAGGRGKNHGSQGGGKGSAKTTSLALVVNPRAEAAFFSSESKGKPIVLRRRLTRVAAFTATSGNGFAFAEASGQVVNATEWAQLSPNYQQYRVRAVRARLVPRNFINNGFAATVWFPGVVVAARYPSGSPASSIAGIYAEGGSSLHTCLDKVWIEMATMDDNPDAALFTDCNAGAPPALSQYGVQFLGTTAAPAIYNGVITHDVFIDYDVEFVARN